MSEKIMTPKADFTVYKGRKKIAVKRGSEYTPEEIERNKWNMKKFEPFAEYENERKEQEKKAGSEDEEPEEPESE
jgi:hypothetical protein